MTCYVCCIICVIFQYHKLLGLGSAYIDMFIDLMSQNIYNEEQNVCIIIVVYNLLQNIPFCCMWINEHVSKLICSKRIYGMSTKDHTYIINLPVH